jgi:hypothetical protein
VGEREKGRKEKGKGRNEEKGNLVILVEFVKFAEEAPGLYLLI